MTGVMIIDMEAVRKTGGLNSVMRSQYVREMGLICFNCCRGLGRYIVRRQGASRAWYYCVPCAARLSLISDPSDRIIDVNAVNEKEAAELKACDALKRAKEDPQPALSLGVSV